MQLFKYGCFGLLTIGLLLTLFFPLLLKYAFGPVKETVIIKQSTGGELICESTYTADIHSWYYFIDYSYNNLNGDTIHIGTGEYEGKEWDRTQQIVTDGEWLTLKTGEYHDGKDKILIGKLDSTKWRILDSQ